MARVPYPAESTLSPETRELLDRLPPLNVFRMLAGGEALPRAFSRFGNRLSIRELNELTLTIGFSMAATRYLEIFGVDIEDATVDVPTDRGRHEEQRPLPPETRPS